MATKIKCKYCGLTAPVTGKLECKKWIAKHESLCPKNPAFAGT